MKDIKFKILLEETMSEEKNRNNAALLSHVITVENASLAVRRFLYEKLEQYRRRQIKSRNPLTVLDAMYKEILLTLLFEQGSVDTFVLSVKIFDEHGFLDCQTFNNACGVVEDYILTGGKKCVKEK